MPWVNVDFYTPIGSDGEYVDLRAALIAAAKTSAANRLRERGEMYRLFLESAKEYKNGTVMGTVARVRMHGLPGKFRGTDFSLNDLDLAETDGVAEEVSFLISHELQTIALQRNGGFRSTSVEDFLTEITEIPVAFDPKVRVDKLSRLNGIEEFTEVSFKLSQPLNDSDFDDTLPGVGMTIRDAAQIGTLATVELTIRLRTGEDNPQNVGTIRKLLRKLDGREDAIKISAKGRRPNSKIEPVDLIRDRIVAGDNVKYGNSRRLDGKQCRLLLRKAMSTNQLFLEGLLGKPA